MVTAMLQDWLVEIVPDGLLLRGYDHVCFLMVFTGWLLRSLTRLSLLRHKASMEPVGMMGSRVALGSRFIPSRALLHLLRHCYARRLLLYLQSLHRGNRQLPSLLTCALLLCKVWQRYHVGFWRLRHRQDHNLVTFMYAASPVGNFICFRVVSVSKLICNIPLGK